MCCAPIKRSIKKNERALSPHSWHFLSGEAECHSERGLPFPARHLLLCWRLSPPNLKGKKSEDMKEFPQGRGKPQASRAPSLLRLVVAAQPGSTHLHRDGPCQGCTGPEEAQCGEHEGIHGSRVRGRETNAVPRVEGGLLKTVELLSNQEALSACHRPHQISQDQDGVADKESAFEGNWHLPSPWHPRGPLQSRVLRRLTGRSPPC